MGITVNWTDNSQTCLLLTYEKGWTWEDFFNTSPVVAEFLNSVDHPVDTIHDVSSSTIPTNVITQLPKLTRGSSTLKHPNSRYVVMVGPTHYLRILIGIFQRLYHDWGQRVILAATLDEAHAALIERTGTPV
jgi:hypothetical protein